MQSNSQSINKDFKSITICKNSHCHNHVRVIKFLNYFNDNGFEIDYLCWLRSPSQRDPNGVENYIFYGGGFGGKILALFYPLWITVLFFHLMKKSFSKNNIIFAIDFDTALPAYLVTLLRPRLQYIYDIHDDFALRYKFPKLLKGIISKIDSLIKKRAMQIIHVDETRIRSGDKNFTVIYNTPKDYFSGNYPKHREYNPKKFAVSGLLCAQRGIHSLTQFAINNPDFEFIVAGDAIDDCASKFIALENVNFLGYVDQSKLFEEIFDASYIFSLYDPSIEINRLAASNKLYDSMMLGIPVVVNTGILAANLVKNNDIGYLISFNFDSSWDALKNSNKEVIARKGQNGRKLYEEKFSYNSNFKNKLDLIFNNKDA